MEEVINEELRKVRFLPRRPPVKKRVGLRRAEVETYLVLMNEVLNDDFSVREYEIMLDGPFFYPFTVSRHATREGAERAFYDAVFVTHVEFTQQHFTFARFREILMSMILRNIRYLFRLMWLVGFGYFLNWLGVFDLFIEIYGNVTDYLGIREPLDEAIGAVVNYKEIISKYFLIFLDKAQKFNEGIF